MSNDENSAKVAVKKAGSHQVTGTVKADGITESAAQIPSA